MCTAWAGDLLSDLCPSLQKKIKLLQAREVIKWCLGDGELHEEKLAASIAESLTRETYMPDDKVITCGQAGDGIYFITGEIWEALRAGMGCPLLASIEIPLPLSRWLVHGVPAL